MPTYINTFNQFVSTSVVAMQAICLLLVVFMLFVSDRNNVVRKFFKDYAFYFGFLISLGAIALSLFYSNVIGFPVCELCYLQRIFIYPQFILFGMELYKRDRSIVDFSMAFALLGILTSIYHIYIEHGGTSGLPCAAPSATEVSCATRYVFEFSYVTIPVMALTASLFILLLMVNYKYVSRIK
jgi:disulfide bond formation protein DsbB